jgi:hypothetical protein
MPVILTTQKAEIRKSMLGSEPWHIIPETLSQKKKSHFSFLWFSICLRNTQSRNRTNNSSEVQRNDCLERFGERRIRRYFALILVKARK